MPKITRFGGASVAGITDTATGQTASGSGFTDDTEATRVEAAARAGDEGTRGLRAGGDDVPDDPAQEPPFDPGELSVSDVQALLENASPAEREAVVDAERRGKNRKGIVGE